MIDPQTCKAARANLCDAMAQLLEIGHAMAVAPTAPLPIQAIGALAEDVGALVRALQVFERRSDDG